jgi:hypothetical protein
VFIALGPALSDTGNLEPMNASTTTRLLWFTAIAAIEREKNFFFEEKVYGYLSAEGEALVKRANGINVQVIRSYS